MKISIRQALQASVVVSESIASLLGEKATVDRRRGAALALLTLSVEHREAILLLVEVGARPSAMALARTILETYATGLWLETVATDLEADEFLAGSRPPPKFETVMQRLRKDYPFGEVFEKLRIHYRMLSDYTHGYARQASRLFGPEGILPTHSEEQMVEVLRFADAVALLACMSREDISDRSFLPFGTLLESVLKSEYYPVAH